MSSSCRWTELRARPAILLTGAGTGITSIPGWELNSFDALSNCTILINLLCALGRLLGYSQFHNRVWSAGDLDGILAIRSSSMIEWANLTVGWSLSGYPWLVLCLLLLGQTKKTSSIRRKAGKKLPPCCSWSLDTFAGLSKSFSQTQLTRKVYLALISNTVFNPQWGRPRPCALSFRRRHSTQCSPRKQAPLKRCDVTILLLAQSVRFNTCQQIKMQSITLFRCWANTYGWTTAISREASGTVFWVANCAALNTRLVKSSVMILHLTEVILLFVYLPVTSLIIERVWCIMCRWRPLVLLFSASTGAGS
jgi:hypothetical protein